MSNVSEAGFGFRVSGFGGWVAVLAIFGGVFLASVALGDTVTLREEACVKGPKILLGDVAEIDGDGKGELAQIELAPAAAPRASTRLDAALIVARLKSAGVPIESVDLKGARAVRATTLHREISSEMISEELRAFIEHEIPWDPKRTQIDIAAPAQGFVVPDGEVVFEWRAEPQYRYLGTGAIRGAVAVDGEVKRSFVCKTTIEAYADVVVAAVDIPRGKVLGAADLRTEERALSSLREQAFNDPSAIEGFESRAAITAGQLIGKRSVAPRAIVKRGQIVVVETAAGGLHIETEAQADANAAEGEVVTCTNLSSKQAFQGTVRADGVVVVH